MKPVTITPRSGIRGTISLPGDKSISHRAALLAALCCGDTRISNFLFADDCLVTLRALRALGVDVRTDEKKREVVIRADGVLRPSPQALDMGESGTSCRMLLGVLAGQNFATRLQGAPSLSKRPMLRVLEPLRLMGGCISGRRAGNEEYLPLVVGPAVLAGIDWTQKVASAQVKSAILLAGLSAAGTTIVRETVPTRDHTERLLRHFHAAIQAKKGVVKIKKRALRSPGRINIPADMSSAAFFIVLGLLAQDSDILLKDVGINPTRTGLLRVLGRMGGRIQLLGLKKACEPVADIRVRSSRLKGTVVRESEIPALIDELPILMVAASRARGRTVIRGAGELRFKETDRIESMAVNLAKLGANIEVKSQKKSVHIQIDGVTAFGSSRLKSFSDHRTAMSMVVSGLTAQGPCIVDDISCISKSFPDFMRALNHLLGTK